MCSAGHGRLVKQLAAGGMTRAPAARTGRWLGLRIASLVVVAVGGSQLKDTLSVDGEWWFDRLRGISHHYAGAIGPMHVHDNRFVALPEGDFFLILLYSPWWYHCRRQAAEFDRLAEGLNHDGLSQRVRAVTLDCSSPAHVAACAVWLGPPRPAPHVEYVGDNAPKYNRLVYNSLADAWPSETLSNLLFGSRADFLAVGSGSAAETRIESVTVPQTASAHWMLAWVNRECSQSFGEVPLKSVRLESELAFRERSFQLRGHRPAQYATRQGCICRDEWQRCSKSFWGMLGGEPQECTTYHHCPENLGFCETVWPCGEHHSRTDKCDPSKEVADEVASTPRDGHSHEQDALAALALWLHDIFERHTFETEAEDPQQRRRGALVDFLQMLCSYFPDHLEGRLHQLEEGWDPEHQSQCRASLCRLGGLLSEPVLWRQYTEVVDAEIVWQPLRDQGPLPGDQPSLEARPGRVQRIRWQRLETDWKLCGRPWSDFARLGFGACQASDPLASGLPCGTWQLMHALSVEAVVETHCPFRRTNDVDRCVGPRHNKTHGDVLKLHKERSQERIAERIALASSMAARAKVPLQMSLSSVGTATSRCFKVPGSDSVPVDSVAVNASLSMVVSERSMPPLSGRLTVKGKLRTWPSYMSLSQPVDSVELELVPDFIREDGGAIVVRTHSDAAELQLQNWKLVAVGGVPLESGAGDWYKMLEHALPGETILEFAGPIPCGTKDTEALCLEPCSVWSLVPAAATPLDARELTKEFMEHLKEGKLMESVTRQCLGRLTTHRYGLPWLVDVLGLGMMDCDAAPVFHVGGRVELHNMTFCSSEPFEDCIELYDPPQLPIGRWVEVDVHPAVHAGVIDARTFITRLRRMVGLFWRCEECRRNFLSFEFGAHTKLDEPRDALVWLWRAHNAISMKLQSFESYAVDYPPDPARSKDLWPTPSMCPTCWSRLGAERGRRESYVLWKTLHPHSHYQHGIWNESEVVNFLVTRFYASSAAYREQGASGQAFEQNRTPVTELSGVQLLAAATPPSIALRRGLLSSRYLAWLGAASLVVAAAAVLLSADLGAGGRVASPPVQLLPPPRPSAMRAAPPLAVRRSKGPLSAAWSSGSYTRVSTEDDDRPSSSERCSAARGPCSCTPLL